MNQQTCFSCEHCGLSGGQEVIEFRCAANRRDPQDYAESRMEELLKDLDTSRTWCPSWSYSNRVLVFCMTERSDGSITKRVICLAKYAKRLGLRVKGRPSGGRLRTLDAMPGR